MRQLTAVAAFHAIEWELTPLSIPSIADDLDPDTIISRLAGPLTPDAQRAFRRVAEEALARLPCYGAGIAYRTVAALQAAYFDPPDFRRAAWDISQERGVTTKLLARPALAYGGDQRHVRYRQPKAVG